MKKKYELILYVVLLIQYISVIPANADLIQDSLINQVIHESNPEKKILKYIDLVKYYQRNDVEKALEFGNIALTIAYRNDLKDIIPVIEIEKARCYIFKGQIDSNLILQQHIEKELKRINRDKLWGEFYLLKQISDSYVSDFSNSMENSLIALTYFRKANDSLGLARTYNNIGVNFQYTGNDQKALENYLISKDFAQSANLQDLLVSIYNNIGIVYDNLGDKDKALEYYYKSLEISNRLNDIKSSAGTFSNIASILTDQKRYSEALVYYRKSLTLSSVFADRSYQAVIYNNLGDLFKSMENLDSAEFFISKAVKIRNEIQDFYGLTESYYDLGTIYLTVNNRAKAKEYFWKAHDLSKKLNVLSQIKSAELKLAEIFNLEGDYKKAYQMMISVNVISDTILEQTQKEQLKYSDLQVQFKNQMNEHEEDLQQYESDHLLQLNRQKKERSFFLLMLVGIIVIAVILLWNFERSNKIKNILLKKNKEIEEQRALMEISNIELTEQYTFTETLLNTIPNPVFYTDKSGVLLGSNNAFELITAKPADHIIGMDLDDLNLWKSFICDSPKILETSGNQVLRNEGVMTFSDGIEHDVICYQKGIIDPNNRIIGLLGIIIDITDIKKIEKSLKQSKAQLKEAINSKDKFFNIMAHDLKNPFNAILGLSGIISDNYDDHTEEERKTYIMLINQSAVQIYNLLENLLEWARAQSGSIERNPSTFLINEPIQECINLFSHSLSKKHIELSFQISDDFLVFADKNMMLTVIRNLLTNAIKYTPVKGKIAIDVVSINSMAQVTITDSGIGIAPDNIDKLFKIDQPVTTPGIDNEKGTGLGLIICQEFVKLNEGEISVKSRQGKGTTFAFTLPLAKRNN